jgi:hypothetical protein
MALFCCQEYEAFHPRRDLQPYSLDLDLTSTIVYSSCAQVCVHQKQVLATEIPLPILNPCISYHPNIVPFGHETDLTHR